MDKNNNKNRYQEAIYSNLIKRRNYSKIETDNFISNVLDVQKEYYNNHLEKEIEEICTTYFPITHPKSKYEVHYNGLAFSKLEASDEQEAIVGGKSYDRPLYLDLSVVNNETGEIKRVRQEKKALAKGIFFGRIPLMTNRGTFIINGVEKIVANQILRSPGVYALNKSHVKLSTKKKQLSGYICEILPYRGTQLQFVIDIIEKEDALGNIHHHDTFIKVVARNATGDEAVTFPATKLLKALGFTQAEIIETFKHDEFIINTLNHKDEYKHSTIFQDEQVRVLKKIYNDLKTSNKDKKTLSSLDNKLREAVFAACEIQEKLDALKDEYNNRLLELEKNGNDNEKLLNSVNSIHERIKKAEANLNEQLDIMITERSASDIIKGLSISIRAAEANYSERNKICYQDVIVDHFMNPRYFDLSAAGRYRMQRKLRITERLYKTTIAEDLKIGNKTIPAGTYIDKEHLDNIKQSLRVGKLELTNIKLHTLASAQKKHNNTVETISIYDDNEKKSFIIPIIGVVADVETTTLTIADFISTISYLISFYYGVGKTDDIDHLGNKRIRLIHEQLKNKLKAGMAKVERYVKEKLSTISSKTANEETQAKIDLKATVNSIVNTKAFQGAIRNFFNTYDLTQLLDQDNPLSEITHKRRISSMGEGGISREDPNLSIRDVHYSQYGRICPIESPEGQNIGLILSLTSLAEIDPKTGFLMTPYKRVIKGVIQDEVMYMTSLQEEEYNICEATIPKDNKKIIGYDGMAIVRYRSSQNVVPIEHVDFIEVTPRQIVSVAASCIPFLENDDNARALMGANMQRQAVPLLKPYAPIVGTGTEYQIAHDSGMAIVANDSGEVVSVDGNKITLQTEKSKKHYKLTKYRKSNQGTCINQTPIVTVGQKVKANQTIANGPAMQNGELALGRNPLVAFTTWNGYNFEDAVVISERLIKDDIYTSISIIDKKIECKHLDKLGDEEFTRDIPNVSEESKKMLDADGIILVGSHVKEGDILVGKVAPKPEGETNPIDKLVRSITGDKYKNKRDVSLTVNHGEDGVVISVNHFKQRDGAQLENDVFERVVICIAQKRKIQIGDKMAGRHGNKGIVSIVVPVADMPHLEDGTPIDICLNPLGVPSRMNIGQIMEVHLGLAMRKAIRKSLIEFYINEESADKYVQEFGLEKAKVKQLLVVLKKYIAETDELKKATSFNALYDKFTDTDLTLVLRNAGLDIEDLSVKAATPVFVGANIDDITSALKDVDVDAIKTQGKFSLIDGKTGEYFDGKITVGVMYMMKLDHMVDDKIHARSVGPYSKLTQQPLGGKAQNGGQRFGEMEVWALEAYGAAYNLQELLTIKSDDYKGKKAAYSAIIKGRPLPTPSIPESFKLFTKLIQGLCLSLTVDFNDDSTPVDVNDYVATNVLDDEDDEQITVKHYEAVEVEDQPEEENVNL